MLALDQFFKIEFRKSIIKLIKLTNHKEHRQSSTRSTVFTRICAAALIKFFAPQVRRLIESSAYLKIGH